MTLKNQCNWNGGFKLNEIQSVLDRYILVYELKIKYFMLVKECNKSWIYNRRWLRWVSLGSKDLVQVQF